MKVLLVSVWMLLTLFVLFDESRAQQGDYEPNRVLFRVNQNFRSISVNSGVVQTDKQWFNQLCQQYQIAMLDSIFRTNLSDLKGYYSCRYESGAAVPAVVDALMQRPDVVYAEPNYYVHFMSDIPDDPLFGQQWGLEAINLPSAWDITTGENGSCG